jgi:hypothetical protein
MLNGYVIVRNDDGKFVTPPGSEHSYTNNLQHALVFMDRETAKKQRCPESEHVVSLDNLLHRQS